jgi:transcription initiation factor TFIIIB Brf1 subunit/transcription initiation factor TFIIB
MGINSKSFCARALPAGREFSRRLYLACARARKPHHLIKITKAMQSNILTWKMFLENFNGFSYILDDSISP